MEVITINAVVIFSFPRRDHEAASTDLKRLGIGMPILHSHSSPRPFQDRLEAYGCTDIIHLNQKLSEPSQLDYLDLLPTRGDRPPKLSAVAEHQGTALLYLVDACGDAKADAASLASLSRQLANRSDPAWLGVLRLGSLEIFPIGFHETEFTQPIRTIEAKSANAPLFFQSLVHGTFEENHRLQGTDFVYRKIFGLLTQTTNEFVPQKGNGELDSLDVLSMAGRALFFRFLIDRSVVLEKELHGSDGICQSASELKDAFSSAENAANTSAWLDATFNGDFFPLIDETIPAGNRNKRRAAYLQFYQRVEGLVGKRIFRHLNAILRGWRATGKDIQRELDWGDLDFAHIPVGVLSQVYESFSHRADPRTARDTSVHYTPRTIAGLMVEQAFAALKDPASATVLDPSCGAGIFLVLAFRRLVSERWSQDNERPKTAIIQEILYNQIRGFDISEPALRLAALGLYITAIELNGSPRPPQSLKFPRNLRDEVLHQFGGGENQEQKSVAFPLGSLGPDVSKKFDHSFDIVIGNPPWTRLRDEKNENHDLKPIKSATDELNKEFTAIGRRVLISRGSKEFAKRYQNPDKNPDLPFLWRAMEWAKEGGIIALAMHARLFGRTSGKGFEAWCAVLSNIELTGLINGADLRKTAVWDGMDAPFCIFFARNFKPSPGHRFQFAAPSYEPDLNGGGRFRIDYEAAQPVSAELVKTQPWVLKALSLGTWLDVKVIQALTHSNNKTLADRWTEWDKKGQKTGKGYDRSPGVKQNPAEFLGNLLDFRRHDDQFTISFDKLITFSAQFGILTANCPRTARLYSPPVVIIPQSPGDDVDGPRAYLSDQALAFSQSYYGYSCTDHPEADTLSSLIYLLPHSTLVAYFCLMTSRRSGFDRQTFNKEEFDALPFPDVGNLSIANKSRICSLASRLQRDLEKPWQEIEEFLFGLYGLDADAIQVVKDTLYSAGSYRRAGKASLEQTTRESRAEFVKTLTEELNPYFDVCGEHVSVSEASFQSDSWKEPWFFLAISKASGSVPINPQLIRKAMDAANDRGCSRIIVHAPGKRGILCGLLNQNRWWTITRARLCAQHIIREHLAAFGLPEEI